MKNKRLIEALEYAISIIESYELDIRNINIYFEGKINKKGFCQGNIYKNAIKDIKKKAGL